VKEKKTSQNIFFISQFLWVQEENDGWRKYYIDQIKILQRSIKRAKNIKKIISQTKRAKYITKIKDQ